jgi:hypothetical protein
MALQKIQIRALVFGIFALCLWSYLVVLTKPDCKDSTLKTWLVGVALFSQWPIVGALTGYLARRIGWLHGLLVAVLSSPLISVLWLCMLWSWRAFSLPFYWSILQGFLMASLPLTIIGGLLGSFFYAKLQARQLRVTS